MQKYYLASYRSATGPRAGVVVNQSLFDVTTATGQPNLGTVGDVLDNWDVAVAALDCFVRKPGGPSTPICEVQFLAPVAKPGAIYCAGANYHDHAIEMRQATNQPPQPDPHTVGLKPWFFVKSSHTVANPNDVVSISSYSRKMDWELELVAVIGRKARNLTIENAFSCVAGYTIGNDLSARDLGTREQVPVGSPLRADWFRHKSFDGGAPMGPWIVPATQISDPGNLDMKLWVNDTLKQNSNTNQMIFTIAEQIAHLTSGITLYPGDVIMTGTPAGVGAPKSDFLAGGDVVKMEIAEVGSMSFKVS